MSSAAIAWSHSRGQLAVVDLEVVVAVPRLAGAVPDLHEAHAALDQPAGDEHLPGLHAGAVHVADVLRLAARRRTPRPLRSACGSRVRTTGCGLRARVVLPGLQVAAVERSQQVELLALLRAATMRSLRMCSMSCSMVGVLRVDVGALVDAGQEAGLPVLRLLDRVAARAHGDEAGRFWFSVPRP